MEHRVRFQRYSNIELRGALCIERSQKSVTLDFPKNDKKTDRLDFDRGYLLID